MVHPKIVLTIYHSGNVILTGGKVRAPPARRVSVVHITLAYSRAQTVNDIYTAFENIYPVLQEFRVASSEPRPAT